MSVAVAPLKFELRVRKTKHAGEDAPDQPKGFKPLEGDHPTVATEADRLNRVQGQSRPHYFFFPEVAGDFDRLHCDMCKRIAIREASED